MSAYIIQNFLTQLQQSDLRLSHLILYVLQQYKDPANPLLRDLIDNTITITSSFYHFHSDSNTRLSQWAHELKCTQYAHAIQLLVRKENGWHFRASHTHPDQIRDFRLEDMIAQMHQLAPELCDLVHRLLGCSDVPMDQDEPPEVESDSDDDLWEALGVDLSGADAKTTGPRGRKVLRNVFMRIVRS